MSSKNNVNPDHYKVAGRDRPNETIPPGHDGDPKLEAKAKPAKRRKAAAPNFIPGAAPVGEKPEEEEKD
jgi:hypothetical protein